MITHSQVIESFINRFSANLNTTCPAIITEVVTEGDYIEYISAKLVNNKLYKSGESVIRQEISNIPLLFPSSSEGIMSYPVKTGDPVLLVFSQEDIDTFLHDGTLDKDPNSYRKFSLSDAIAIPCIHPVSSDVKAHKENFQITYNDVTISIEPSGKIFIGTPTDIQASITGTSNWTSDVYKLDSKTISLGNGSVEIVKYLSDLTKAISDITVGGTPIDNKATFTAMKLEIDQLL